MITPLQNGELFLIDAGFDLYLMILTFRFILAWVGADQFNPITRFIIKATQPLIIFFRKFLPTVKNIELSTLALIILVDALKFFLASIIVIGLPFHFFGLFILALADTIRLLLNTFFWSIILQAVLSLVQQGYTPVSRMLQQVTAPILAPIQRIIPPIGGIDISPIPALILLRLITIVLVEPMIGTGMSLTFG